MVKDYYKTLGIDRDASAVDIKKAYRKLALSHHPDKKGNDKEAEDEFKEINEAYEVLKDPQKKAHFDRFGTVGGRSQGGGQQAGAGGFQDLFEDVFSDFFGGAGGGRQRVRAGNDLRYDLRINFNDAAFGVEEEITVPRSIHCSTCDATGATEGSKPTTCNTCQGSGQVRFQQGFFAISKPCSSCKGTGQIITDPCKKCHGKGKVISSDNLTVKIPAGVEDGTRLRLVGEGEAGEIGAPPGDLYVFLSVKNHSIFERDGVDLYCEVPISFTDAALGGEIEIPTLTGSEKLKIPSATQSGKRFKIKDKGIASLKTGRRGDLFVIAYIETPTKLNAKQKELLKKFSEHTESKQMPLINNFTDKIKELLK